jgi:hypothetical protein
MTIHFAGQPIGGFKIGVQKRVNFLCIICYKRPDPRLPMFFASELTIELETLLRAKLRMDSTERYSGAGGLIESPVGRGEDG